MFTNNFVTAQKSIFLNQTNTYTYADGSKVSTAGAYLLGMLQIGPAMGRAKCGNPTDDVVNSYVYFGSGSTPATKDDYTLEAPITSGLAIENGSTMVAEVREGEYCAWASYVVKNTTNDTVNIYEIGAFCSVSIGTTYRKILAERTVLTEPIVIPAGKSKIVTYKITFNQTLNVE